MILPALLAVAALGAPERAREMRVAMGTFAEIEISGAGEPEKAIAAAFDRIDAVEEATSAWSGESEVSRLSRSGEALVSKELFFCLEKALELSRASKGAFDVTRTASGFERVHLDPLSHRVRLPPGLRIDLGGMAKGYAVDLALDVLRRAGARSAIVDLGTSSIGVFGEEPVSFEIRNPEGGPPPATFRLMRGAVGSSSRDQRGNHIVDPRTGAPADGVLAVTVVAETALEADGLDTAAFVLGAPEGLALLEERGADGVVLSHDGGRLVLQATRRFAERYALEVADWVALR